MNWLEKIQPPKYLRYFFYIAYSWYRPYVSERVDAHISSVLLLWFIHIPSIFFINSIVGDNKMPMDDFSSLLYLFILLLLHYYFFLYRGKWKNFVKEFKGIERRQRKNGLFYLFIYLLFFALIIFPLSLKIGDMHK